MNDFDRLIVKAVVAAFIVLVTTIGGCTMQENYLLSQSANPVALSCAMGDMNKAVCGISVGRAHD